MNVLRLLPFLLLSGLSLGLGSCSSKPGPYSNHWNVDGLGDHFAYHGLSYRQDRNASYIDHQWQQKRSIDVTLRRHFLNSNPDNPFQPEDTSFDDPRPVHSILPDTLHYFHAESVAWGLVFLASSGTFIPVPVGSILGTLDHGGGSEFVSGLLHPFGGASTLGEPAPVSEFRVKNP